MYYRANLAFKMGKQFNAPLLALQVLQIVHLI